MRRFESYHLCHPDESERTKRGSRSAVMKHVERVGGCSTMASIPLCESGEGGSEPSSHPKIIILLPRISVVYYPGSKDYH